MISCGTRDSSRMTAQLTISSHYQRAGFLIPAQKCDTSAEHC